MDNEVDDPGPVADDSDGGTTTAVADEPDVPAEIPAADPPVSAGKCDLSGVAGAVTSKWAQPAPDGTLTYATRNTGERLLDFSYAGYMGGGVAIPNVDSVVTVRPSGGDDTNAIQKAIDDVSSRPLMNGFRGAVLLASGNFHIRAGITIRASGVVLRGSGEGDGGTTLTVGGKPGFALVVAGRGSYRRQGSSATITDDYVPSGSRTFHVDDPGSLKVGQSVVVDRPVTKEWIHFMGMDQLVRDGKRQTWLQADDSIKSDRVIRAINGNEITVDAPLSDSLDKKYLGGGATVYAYTYIGRLQNVGIESVKFVAPKTSVAISKAHFGVIDAGPVLNSWIRNVASEEFISGIRIREGSKWVTIQDTSLARTSPINNGAGYPSQFDIAGQQTLVHRVSTAGDNHMAYVTQRGTPGPNVVLGLRASGGNNTPIEGHQRWATGLLVDSTINTSDIRFWDRGNSGSGHGWAMGWGVAWNNTTKRLLVQEPPGTTNWGIGGFATLTRQKPRGQGNFTPATGTTDDINKALAPKSLYLAQLCLRLGPSALKNIGY